VDVYIKDRQKNANSHRRAADVLVMLDPAHFGHRAVAGRHEQTRFLRNGPGRAAKKIDYQSENDAGTKCQPPEPSECQRDGNCEQRITHELQFCQAPTSKRNRLAPAKWVVFRRPISRTLIARVFQIARVENLVRRSGGISALQASHSLHVARAKTLEIPASQIAPSDFDLVTVTASGLNAFDIGGKRLGRPFLPLDFNVAHDEPKLLVLALESPVSSSEEAFTCIVSVCGYI